jgi:hypothetical protein
MNGRLLIYKILYFGAIRLHGIDEFWIGWRRNVDSPVSGGDRDQRTFIHNAVFDLFSHHIVAII